MKHFDETPIPSPASEASNARPQPSAAEHERVLESFHRICDAHGGPELTKRFYANFFGRHPDAEDLFGSHSFATQQQMLLETLTAVVDHLDDANWLATNMVALGMRHHDYGVTVEMYAWWIDSMLTTLAGLEGDAWSDALEVAWRHHLAGISAMVCDAGPGAPLEG